MSSSYFFARRQQRTKPGVLGAGGLASSDGCWAGPALPIFEASIMRASWRESAAACSGCLSSMSLISARQASFFDERSDDDRAAAPSLPALAFRPNEFSANAAKLSPQEG